MKYTCANCGEKKDSDVDGAMGTPGTTSCYCLSPECLDAGMKNVANIVNLLGTFGGGT
jgi:hypothetical protein